MRNDDTSLRHASRRLLCVLLTIVGCCWVLFVRPASAQVDQGAITGVVQDLTGAVVPGAQVTLTNTDTGFVLQGKSNGRGDYVFSPIKIGNYTVSATASGFETTTQENVRVNIQDRLYIPIVLKPGGVKETVTVTTAPPLLQGESASVGQVMDTETIDNTPLNGRNYVFVAQLTAGTAPSVGGNSQSRGQGDFFANGQRATQNNFILDGVDNNVDADDFQNGASYNVTPPPDALAEFKVSTSNYSAEFGHSAGAVVNASIKSGTNQVHGDLWEYVRNTKLDAQDWDAASIPPYHQNQFGATLGLPLIKNKLFYFGDIEATRITYASTFHGTVPTPLMRQGNFTELFNGANNLSGVPDYVYAPTTAGTQGLTGTSTHIAAAAPGCQTIGFDLVATCTTNILSGANVTIPSGTNVGVVDNETISPAAQTLANLFPAPNTNGWTSANNSLSVTSPGIGGATFNNYVKNVPTADDTIQWDQRLDWNPSAKDQAYVRYSYTHLQVANGAPLGNPLDGGGFGTDGTNFNLAENFMASETHLFTQNLINELRFGYNWGNYQFLQLNSNVNEAAKLGLGGIPFTGTSEPNGGLPSINTLKSNGNVAGDVTTFGSSTDLPSVEHQNVYQILDNLTTVYKNHSLKFGVQLQSIRTSISQANAARNIYHYGPYYTGFKGKKNSGAGFADFLTDNMLNAKSDPDWNVAYYRWYRSAYAQDDWKINSRLTLNLGLRYDFTQPISNKAGDIANFLVTSSNIGTGTGHYELSSKVAGQNLLNATFQSLLASNGIDTTYASGNSLTNAQKYNFAPRVGFAYRLNDKTVVRGGYGIFFGGLEAPGAAEMTVNFPWAYVAVVFNNPTNGCGAPPTPNYVAVDGIYAQGCPSNATADPTANPPLPFPTTLAQGFGLWGPNGAAGLGLNPALNSSDVNIKTPYTQSFNLTVERELSKNMVFSIAYVGNLGRHLYTALSPNDSNAIEDGNNNASDSQPFPGLGYVDQSAYVGESYYNGLQAKLEKRLSDGLSFLASYTYSRAFDDSTTPGGIEGGINARDPNLIPLWMELTPSAFDTRQRVTLNGLYDLPFGKGRRYMHTGGALDYLIGGWSTSLTWQAQTGNPITISPNGSTPLQATIGEGGADFVGNSNANRIANPFAGGGKPGPNNAGVATCPTSVKNKTHWYNPCAFDNPADASGIDSSTLKDPEGQPVVSDLADVIKYIGGKSNQMYGPGWDRVNMSLFKSFKTWREQYVQFRADSFNLLNHPSLANPTDDTSDDAGGGDILGPAKFQNLTPDARFFQIAAKYVF
jgi:hypothetical protein